MRIHYRHERSSGFFHMLRAIQNRSNEEARGE